MILGGSFQRVLFGGEVLWSGVECHVGRIGCGFCESTEERGALTPAHWETKWNADEGGTGAEAGENNSQFQGGLRR